MEKLGLVVAVEMQAIREKYGEPEKTYRLGGFPAGEYTISGKKVTVVRSGAGEIAAAAAAQALICGGAEAVLNFGVAGGLTDEMSRERICAVEYVVHYDMDTSAADDTETGRYTELPDIRIPADPGLLELVKKTIPDIRTVGCASADKFIGDEAQKRNLAERFQCEICEMEAAGIALTCLRNGIPCLLIKMVADGVKGGAKEFRSEFDAAAAEALRVLEKCVENY